MTHRHSLAGIDFTVLKDDAAILVNENAVALSAFPKNHDIPDTGVMVQDSSPFEGISDSFWKKKCERDYGGYRTGLG